MDNLISVLSNVISDSIPSVAIMFTGLLALFLSHGALGAKISLSSKKFLTAFGYLFLVSGGVLTLIVAVLQIQSTYPEDFSNIYPVIVNRQNAFLLFLILIAWWDIHTLIKRFRILSYKVLSRGVFDQENAMANILVENVSKDTLSCHARLEKMYFNGEERNVDAINPNGWYLRWDRKDQQRVAHYAILKLGIPRIVYLAEEEGRGSFLIEFQNRERAYFEGEGLYTFVVGFYRMVGNNFIRFDEFKGSFQTQLKERNGWMEIRWI